MIQRSSSSHRDYRPGSPESIAAILESVNMPGCALGHGETMGCPYLYAVRGGRTGSRHFIRGVIRPIDVVDVAFKAVREVMEQEARKDFTFRGEAIFDRD